MRSGYPAEAGQLVADTGARPRRPHAQVVDRDAELRRRLGQRHLAQVTHHERLALRRRQGVEHGHQDLRAALPEVGVLGAGIGGGGRVVVHPLESVERLLRACTRPPVPPHEVLGDAPQPALDRRAPAELAQPDDREGERLLHEVLGRVGLADEVGDVAVEAIEVVLIEARPGVDIARTGTLDERDLGFLGGIPPGAGRRFRHLQAKLQQGAHCGSSARSGREITAS